MENKERERSFVEAVRKAGEEELKRRQEAKKKSEDEGGVPERDMSKKKTNKVNNDKKINENATIEDDGKTKTADVEGNAVADETNEAEEVDRAEEAVEDESVEEEAGKAVEDETADEEEGVEGEDAEGGEKKKKGLGFLKKKTDKRDEKIEELTDKLMRSMAEFDNFRKRTEREKTQMFEVGAKSIVEKILPVVDNFERGLGVLTEEEKEAPFAQGIEKIYKQLMTSLEEAGVTPIEAVGKEFDPNLHNAVMHEENEELGENIVSMELQKGYKYRDSVVRHSMVKVAN